MFDITTLMTGKKKFSDIFESLPRICTFFHILCFLSYKLGGGKGGRWWLWTSDGCFGWLVHFVWSQFVSCQDILVLRATRFGYKFDPPSLSPKLCCRPANALFFSSSFKRKIMTLKYLTHFNSISQSCFAYHFDFGYIFCAIFYYSPKIKNICPKRMKRLKFQPAVFSHSAYSPHSFLFKRFLVFIPSLLCISHTNRSHSLDCNLFRWKLAKLKFCNFQNLQNWRKMNFSSQLCKIDAKLTFHWNFSFRSPWNCFWCGCQRLRDEGFCRILQKWKILQNSILIRVDESHQPKKGTLIVTNCVSPKISFSKETTSYDTNQWIATASL